MNKQRNWSTAWRNGTVFVATSLVLIVLQLLVILLSWILNVAVPELGVRSLLSGEGLRLMMASYLDNISSLVLGSIILVSVGIGAMVKSGVLSAVSNRKEQDFRHRFAFQMCIVVMVLAVAVALFVVFLPHSPMMSVTGHYFPGPLLYCLIPYISLVMMLISYTYSLFSGDLVLFQQAADIATYGLKKASWLIVLYLIVTELVASIRFVYVF